MNALTPMTASITAALADLVGPRTVILSSMHGSRLYGTAGPDSDIDAIAVFLPTEAEILSGRIDFILHTAIPGEALGAGDIDIKAVSLANFLRLLNRSDVSYFEALFGADIMPIPGYPIRPEGRVLQSNVDRLTGPIAQRMMEFGLSHVGHLDRTRNTIADTSADLLRLATYETIDPDSRIWDVPEILTKVIHLAGLPGGRIKRLEEDLSEDAALALDRKESIDLMMRVRNRQILARDRISKLIGMMKSATRKDSSRSTDFVSGKDFKRRAHGYRAFDQVLELLSQNSLTFPRRAAEDLVKIRSGDIPDEKTAEMVGMIIDDNRRAIEIARDADSPWTKDPDEHFTQEVLVSLHRIVTRG